MTGNYWLDNAIIFALLLAVVETMGAFSDAYDYITTEGYAWLLSTYCWPYYWGTHFLPWNYFRLWFFLESFFLPRKQRVTVRYLGRKLKITWHAYHYKTWLPVRKAIRNTQRHRLTYWESTSLYWKPHDPMFTLTYRNCDRYSYYLFTISFR